ncbi:MULTISPECIES: GNAT family N-acetyltransferase [Brevibacillus]|uniref:GNAT family N-acetyltransferase n=1 Tax=Brevibacillus TaxID=55080 RepID=UPI000D1012F1|nr:MULTISPECIES: GNAT family N-acetyltransferase [Brevibacillus]PSJ68024.1 hypothetical protein C7J99_16525 [Brevibacillus brevis]RED35498.1 ribosomal protein S18 acetylase RimI-like enzyme [Brevibacillus brevis]TQK63817.1 ribosomal protein S18 acetylase RimI-like enzyme [Brevibacillus sp. AG162]VEF89391.1 putative acetyltransferase [Brevibacillus brevis]GEC87836.1 hypothetical protein BBR01nite_01670 [Brevibacillus brevis]
METLLIKSFTELDNVRLEEAANVFIDSYPEMMTLLSRDRAVLVDFMKPSFATELYYAALWNGKVIGIMAYSTMAQRPLCFDKKRMQKAFGTFKGWVYYCFFSWHFHSPLAVHLDECFIESVATSPESRGKGVATALLNYFFEHLPYRDFHLEVVDTNTNAIRLYQKHGFTIVKSKKQRLFRKQAGFNETYTMKKMLLTK